MASCSFPFPYVPYETPLFLKYELEPWATLDVLVRLVINGIFNGFNIHNVLGILLQLMQFHKMVLKIYVIVGSDINILAFI